MRIAETHLDLRAAVRHETRTQTAVAGLLRTGGHRYQAAVELADATTALREAAAVGRATVPMRYRLDTANAVWDAVTRASRGLHRRQVAA
jgi:hypothetical protein